MKPKDSKQLYRDGVQLVIFDWAGTLIDFGCHAPTAAFIECFSQKGINISTAQARGPMGMEKRDHIEAVFSLDTVSSAWEKAYGRMPCQSDIDIMYDAFVSLLLDCLKTHSQLVPGVLQAIDYLHSRNIKAGANTGYFTEAAEIVTRSAEKQGFVADAAVCASDVGGGRPAPWMIYRLMESTGVYPPEAVVNVGDTTVDVETGRNGGVWSIGVAATGNEVGLSADELSRLPAQDSQTLISDARNRLQKSGAHWVINTMEELPGTIEHIEELLNQGIRP